MNKQYDDLPEDIKRLRALIAYLGSKEILAAELEVAESTVNYWLIKKNHIPSKYLLRLSELSNGIFTPSDFLRAE